MPILDRLDSIVSDADDAVMQADAGLDDMRAVLAGQLDDDIDVARAVLTQAVEDIDAAIDLVRGLSVDARRIANRARAILSSGEKRHARPRPPKKKS